MNAQTMQWSTPAFGALSESLHSLAQPLMTVSFAVEIARMSHDPEQWRIALDTVAEECRRATDLLNCARNSAARLEQKRTATERGA